MFEKGTEVRDQVYSEINFHTVYEPVRAVRTKRYKYIKEYDDDLTVIKSNIDASSAKTFLLTHECLEYEKEREYLFDLYADPLERNNLASIREYTEIREKMSALLDKWMEDTNDPLRFGPIKAPEGSLLNKRTDVDAEELSTD